MNEQIKRLCMIEEHLFGWARFIDNFDWRNNDYEKLNNVHQQLVEIYIDAADSIKQYIDNRRSCYVMPSMRELIEHYGLK